MTEVRLRETTWIKGMGPKHPTKKAVERWIGYWTDTDTTGESRLIGTG